MRFFPPSRDQIFEHAFGQRKTKGKQLTRGPRRRNNSIPSAEALVRVYRQEADRQRLLVKKAQLTESRLLFVVSALNKLSQDEDFVNLLRAESLDTLATYLAERSGSARRIENGQTSPDRI